MKILGLILLLTFNTLKAEIIRLPIEFGQRRALTFDTNIKNDEIGSQINSLGGSFSSSRGHRANAAINLLKSDGIINYAHKYSNGTVTFDSNIISNGTVPQMNSIGSSFASVNGMTEAGRFIGHIMILPQFIWMDGYSTIALFINNH